MKKLWKPALLLAAIAVMVIGLLGSGAWFTDTATTATNEIVSGKLSLMDTGFTYFDLGAIPPMAPGDKTGDVVVVIQNDGNIPLAWFGDLVIDGPALLKEAIYIDYAQMEFLGGNWDEPDDNFILNGVGAGPYPGWYNTLAAANKFGVVGLDVFDTNNGMGVTPYEFKGALKPGYAYRLKLRFGMAEGADDTYQDLSTLNIGFKAFATQVNAKAIDAHRAGLSTGAEMPWLLGQLANQD